MRYVYLHGFASGALSRKATAFASALAGHGIGLEIPDLANGDFEHLTISGQLAVIETAVAGAACRLIGSSMGGYLASLYAAAHPEGVERLVLLAPAFGFAKRWQEMQGPEAIAGWRDSGWLEVYHYGDKANRRVHFGLLEDARRFAGFPNFHQPARIYHGVKDTVVPVDLSRSFARSHPSARLTEMDSDHELTDVLDEILADAVPFLLAQE